MDSARTLEFWYDFASTYSYLAAMRIEDAAARAGITVSWHPFLLGPIFKAQGWATSPFNLYPVKGRYMVRDIERIAKKRRLEFHLPQPFPANSLAAARLALLGVDEGWVSPFSRAVFHAEFVQQADISDRNVLATILANIGRDPLRYLQRLEDQRLKERLRLQTETAMARGIFGAPTFICTGELFWGDDRLEDALEWI
jgi:2-hydroxychromene-2-carboxylate isomerase